AGSFAGDIFLRAAGCGGTDCEYAFGFGGAGLSVAWAGAGGLEGGGGEAGRAEYVPASDAEALEATTLLARTEGIIPALESAHAVAEVVKRAPRMKKSDVVIVNISGRGDKDIGIMRENLKLDN